MLVHGDNSQNEQSEDRKKKKHGGDGKDGVLMIDARWSPSTATFGSKKGGEKRVMGEDVRGVWRAGPVGTKMTLVPVDKGDWTEKCVREQKRWWKRPEDICLRWELKADS